jgi:hypothetical protein
MTVPSKVSLSTPGIRRENDKVRLVRYHNKTSYYASSTHAVHKSEIHAQEKYVV